MVTNKYIPIIYYNKSDNMNAKDYMGKKVIVTGKNGVFKGDVEGIVLPNENSDIMVIKVSSGYNVAVNLSNIASIEVVDNKKNTLKKAVFEEIKQNSNLKKVAIISMGGTIASRVDYETGGVSPQFSAEDLLRATPEIMNLAKIETIALRNTFSENMDDADWIALSEEIKNVVNKNFDAIIIAHGTDTMHYSSALISFMCETQGIPIVFVGSQRSSDRGSSDSAYNLLGALVFAVESNKSGVFVAMHDSMNDNRIAIHLGTKVRKMHSSRRDAFKSINVLPVAYVDLVVESSKIKSQKVYYNNNYNELLDISLGSCEISNKLSSKVGLLKFHPGLNENVLKYFLQENEILIVEGTGLGHINTKLISLLKKSKCICFMTTQTIYGRINLNVYTTGRELLTAGVIGLEDMLPETAYVKAKYVLGKFPNAEKDKEKIKELMITNLKGEISERTNSNAFE